MILPGLIIVSRLMRRSALLISGLLLLANLAGCVSRQVQTLADLPLPATPAGNCCWQVLQQLDIYYGEQAYALTGALVQAKTGATLVLLDPVGRRLLSVQQQGDQLQTYRAPELPEGLPERFLLASSMLVWWPLADWQSALQQSPEWTLTSSDTSRILNYRGRAIIRADYPPASAAVVDGLTKQIVAQPGQVRVVHQQQPMSIAISTGRWEPL